MEWFQQSCLWSPDLLISGAARLWNKCLGVSSWGFLMLAFPCQFLPALFFFFFISLCYFDYNMCLFIKEKDKLTRRMFCNQRYFHKTASISCFLHTVLERTRASSCLLGVHSSCNLQLMVRVSASGNFSSTHILSLPAVSFLQTETTNLHKVSSY